MTKNTRLEFELEQNEIIKFIFKGFSSAQIASKMNYSRSTISYRINLLFEKYKVTNRREFILVLVSKLLFKKKQIILKNQQLIDFLLHENSELKNILLKVYQNCKNIPEFQQFISKNGIYF